MEQAVTTLQHSTRANAESRPASNGSASIAHNFSKVWEELQNMGLVFAAHGSSEFNTWGRRLSALTREDLARGLATCERHTRDKGKLDLPTFLGYCRAVPRHIADPPVRSVADMRARNKNPRFRELMKVTDAMLTENGEGPITKATKANRLTKHFTEGKTAGQIIEFCQGLYGVAA